MSSKFSFEKIGLDGRDKRVYETLVSSPQSSLRKIASETGINRGSVYESIKKLAEKGLVGSIDVGKQKRYIASDPNTIVELIREKRDDLAKAEQKAATYAESLQLAPELIEQSSFATFYEGHEGVASILRDVLATYRSDKNSSYRVISTKRVSQFMYHNFPNYTQRRVSAKIAVRVIGVGTPTQNPDPLSERRTLTPERGESLKGYTIIYGNKVANITVNDLGILSAIVIENEGVAQLEEELFDHLWSTLE